MLLLHHDLRGGEDEDLVYDHAIVQSADYELMLTRSTSDGQTGHDHGIVTQHVALPLLGADLRVVSVGLRFAAVQR